MQEETRILELLAEVLRQQDQTQAKLQRISEEMREVKQDVAEVKQDVAEVKRDVAGVKQDVAEVKQDVQEVKATQAALLESQQGHQQALRILATNQQKSQRELENIVDILDSVARMQRDMSRLLDRLENPGDFVH